MHVHMEPLCIQFGRFWWTDNQLGYKHLSLMGECSHKCSVALTVRQEQAFFSIILQPFNEMFVINGKPHCYNDTFNYVILTLLLAKNI